MNNSYRNIDKNMIYDENPFSIFRSRHSFELKFFVTDKQPLNKDSARENCRNRG